MSPVCPLYEELYNDPITCNPIPTDGELPILSITRSEIDIVIKKLSSGKSPVIDRIHSEFLKSGGDVIVNILHKLFNLILETGDIPSTFKKALIVVLYKKKETEQSAKIPTNKLAESYLQTF